jgi:uncharacterized protein
MLSLKQTLLLNGISSGGTGIGLIAFASQVRELFEATSTGPFIATGVFFVAFALLVLFTAMQAKIKASLVNAVTFLDVSWVVLSIVLATSTWGSISMLGSSAIIVVAAWVGMMALLQIRGVKLLRLSTTAPSLFTAAMLTLTTASTSGQIVVPNDAKYATAVNVVEQFLEGVQKKNSAMVNAALDSAVIWDQPGNNRFSGVKNNAKEVFAMFGGMLKMTDRTLELTDSKILAQNDKQVVCLLQWKAYQAGGALLQVSNVDVYTVEKNKITNVVIYTSDIRQEDLFWGK